MAPAELSHLLFVALRSVAALAVMVALFVPLEHFFAVRPARRLAPGWPLNLAWYFFNGLVTVALLAPPAAAIAWAVHAILPPAITAWGGSLPLWQRALAALVVGEIGFYWGHRLSHQWPLLWRFHAIHHSAEHLNFLVNTRAHPVDIVFTRLCGLVLLYATGLAAPIGAEGGFVVALVLYVSSLWSFFIHANLRFRLGWLEQVISTPAFHHWHHNRRDPVDRNYAAMLPFVDRLFGTFHLPRNWPAAYGTDTPVPPTLAGQLVSPLLGERAVAGVPPA